MGPGYEPVNGVELLNEPLFICLDHVIPALALVVVAPLESVMFVVICTNVTPWNVQPWNSAFRPLGIVQFTNVMFLNTGRLYVA